MCPFYPGSPPSRAAALKRHAENLLSDLRGIRSIGFAWDDRGCQVLRVDVSPDTDREIVEKRLEGLEADIAVRKVSGRISREFA